MDRSATAGKVTMTLYNSYEGSPYQNCARQLGETVEEFLSRLPPATTRVSTEPWRPWVFIANPFRKAPARKRELGVDKKPLDEGPPEEGSKVAKFEVLGGNLLEELKGIRQGIQMTIAGRDKNQIMQAVNVEKNNIVRKILDTATELHVTSGKARIPPKFHYISLLTS